ncbi:hypothetical protein Dimus_035545, partial [Dionaea muscipula]
KAKEKKTYNFKGIKKAMVAAWGDFEFELEDEEDKEKEQAQLSDCLMADQEDSDKELIPKVYLERLKQLRKIPYEKLLEFTLDLSINFEDASNDRETLESQADELKTEIEVLNVQKNHMQSKINDLEHEITKLKTLEVEKDHVEEKSKESDEIVILKSENADLRETVAELRNPLLEEEKENYKKFV